MKYLKKYAKYLTNLVLWALMLLFIIFAVPRLVGVFLPFILGWIIAIIANPLAKLLERKLKIPRKIGSAIIIILVFAIMASAIAIGVSKLIEESTGFFAQIPSMSQSVNADINNARTKLENVLDTLPDDAKETAINSIQNIIDEAFISIQKIGQGIISSVTDFARNVPSVLIATLITIMSAYFMIADKREITKSVRSVFSNDMNRKITQFKNGINEILLNYLKAQFIILGFIGAILLIGFLILGVKFALLLAILVGLLDFLPFFGTGTALGPWAILEFLNGDSKTAIGLIIIYFATQIARRVIEPKVLGEKIGMSPLLTMVLMYAGFEIFGVLGLIFAAPIGMLIVKLDSQGMFDEFKFIVSDIYKDIVEFRDISMYREKELQLEEQEQEEEQ